MTRDDRIDVGGWPRGRGIDGGIDEIPLPEGVSGRLWLCGKHVIGPDPDGVVARVGATTVVCLTQRHELSDRFPGYVEWLDREIGSRAIWHPIHDLSVPAATAFADLVEGVAARLDAGEHVIVHCAAGIGRAGTLATGLLIRLGMDRVAALRHVAAHRPMAGPEVGAQAALIEAYAAQR
jgi:protein-tyrosine phosphatase